MRRLIALFAVSMLLTACSGMQTHTEVEALNEAKVTGSPFTQNLTSGYKQFVKEKQNKLDYSDANHFARKGLMSAQGKVVMPEPLSNWHLDEASAKELRAARVELLTVLDAGGRSMAPIEAARAQYKFDCWMEQAEQNWVSLKAPACKADFTKSMTDLNSRMTNALPPSEKAGQAVPVRALPATINDPNAIDAGLDKGMFLVFFDFDKNALNSTGQQVIDAIAVQAKERGNLASITIVGHADTRGPDAYNQRLSERRANAVKDALAKKGIEVQLMQASGRGEKELMVDTPNNTREPANRRVEVTFQ
jgi:OmpA-OmpF porin, OOP family